MSYDLLYYVSNIVSFYYDFMLFKSSKQIRVINIKVGLNFLEPYESVSDKLYANVLRYSPLPPL